MGVPWPCICTELRNAVGASPLFSGTMTKFDHAGHRIRKEPKQEQLERTLGLETTAPDWNPPPPWVRSGQRQARTTDTAQPSEERKGQAPNHGVTRRPPPPCLPTDYCQGVRQRQRPAAPAPGTDRP